MAPRGIPEQCSKCGNPYMGSDAREYPPICYNCKRKEKNMISLIDETPAAEPSEVEKLLGFRVKNGMVWCDTRIYKGYTVPRIDHLRKAVEIIETFLTELNKLNKMKPLAKGDKVRKNLRRIELDGTNLFFNGKEFQTVERIDGELVWFPGGTCLSKDDLERVE